MEDARRAGANSARHDNFRLDHLIVYFLYHTDVLLVDRAGDQENIGMFGIARIDNAETLDVVERSQGGKHLDIAAVAAAAVIVNNPG